MIVEDHQFNTEVKPSPDYILPEFRNQDIRISGDVSDQSIILFELTPSKIQDHEKNRARTKSRSNARKQSDNLYSFKQSKPKFSVKFDSLSFILTLIFRWTKVKSSG